MTTAKIYTFSILRSSTDAFADKVPYCSAIVEFENGARLAALLDGYSDGIDVSIGQTVTFLGADIAGNDIFVL